MFGNKGLSVIRLVYSLVAIMVLTIIFTAFDSPINTLHTFGEDQGANQLVLDRYLFSWQNWVGLFIAAIFLYMITSSGESEYKTTGGR